MIKIRISLTEVHLSLLQRITKKRERSLRKCLTCRVWTRSRLRLWLCWCFSCLKITWQPQNSLRTSFTNRMLSQRLSSKPSTFSRVRTSSDYFRKTESGKRPLSTRTSNPSYNWALGSRTCWYLRVFAKHWNKWQKTKSLWTRSERIFRLLTKTNSITSSKCSLLPHLCSENRSFDAGEPRAADIHDN